MKIDLIENPCTFWYEDVQGNKIPFDFSKGFPDFKWHAQFSKGVSVQENICFGQRNGKDLWPVRFLKWLLWKCPSRWKKPTTSMSFNSTINNCWDVIKYLKEQRGFSFNDSCVVASELCDHCGSIIEWELKGEDPNSPNNQAYLKTCRSHCNYCKVIDPSYYLYRRVWACYRTLKLGGDITRAYKEISPNSDKVL